MQPNYDNIDLTYLNTIADGDKDIIKELIEIFLDQVPEFTDGLTESFNNKDWNKMAAIAHKAKSSVVSLGMKILGEIDLKNLELLAKNRRVIELKNSSNNISKTEEDEIIKLNQNLESYPKEKQIWVTENNQDETIKKIIDKFVKNCDIASQQLNSILEN
ncbi:MAG: Hpt domain-containing protein [Marinilabiliaceae bacterium]|nr:Hpt domain-containing protein [Marinilabiliaceae bacterium]